LAFAPFDAVLLDDPREPIPGAVAVQLHFRVERAHAARDRRPPLPAAALRDRAAACQALLGQGLLPSQLRGLGERNLALGKARDPLSLAALLRHLEAYLQTVEESGYLEPSAALWLAADRHRRGERGFWVERHEEDGPLEAGIRDLAPPRLRALCALPELGSIRFRLATRRGAGHGGLFEGAEPHLVRQLLPTLEALAVERGLEHLELDQPEGWGENPWGEALDHLFAGPLALDEGGRAALQRAELPTEAAVWRAAVEQARAWVDGGIDPADITLVHPDPTRLGPLLAPLLAAEGLPFRGAPGKPLTEAPTWASLAILLQGLRDADPAALAAGLGTSSPTSPLGRALRALADRLDGADASGAAALDQAFQALKTGDQAWVRDRWAFLLGLPAKVQTPLRWFQDLESLAQRLELLQGSAFYPALGLLKEGAALNLEPVPFGDFLELLESALGAMRAADPEPQPRGLRLVGPDALESTWTGARATLILDLGEGVWPATPASNPDLDWPRLAALNAALRAQPAGEGAPDFPPQLQTFALPVSEAGEVLPRAFHRAAFGFNRALALTREHLVALSAARDSNGQARAQGAFWRALDGAGEWAPDPTQAASQLRWRWEASAGDALTLARQHSGRALAPGPQAALDRQAPEADWIPGAWRLGGSEECPISPTGLENLARCPFRAMAERLWKLPSWESEDRHPLRLGSLTHRLLEETLGGLEGAPHWPTAFLARHGLPGPTPSLLQDLLHTLWQRAGDGWIAELPEVGAAEAQRLRLALEELLPALADLLAEDLAQTGPTEEEFRSLGWEPGGTWQRSLLGLEYRLEPRRLDLPDGAPCWVHGTVDRLERLTCGEAAFLRVLDYKGSSRATLKGYREEGGAFGVHLQLPLYQALVEAERGLPATTLLLSLKEGWSPVPMMLRGEERGRLLENVAGLLARAREGSFPAAPGEHCGTCGLSALCGRPVDVDAPSDEEAEG
jgi:hypothetical protein